MNRGREGGRYKYPDTLITLQAHLKAVFRLPYRQLEGFTRALAEWEPRLTTPDCSTTGRRVNKLSVHLDPHIDPERPYACGKKPRKIYYHWLTGALYDRARIRRRG